MPQVTRELASYISVLAGPGSNEGAMWSIEAARCGRSYAADSAA